MFGRRLRVYCKFLRSLALTNGRLLRGMWKLTKLPQPAITFFGGSRLTSDSLYSVKAMDLAEKLAVKGFSIITGGGSGVMEAANMGAMKAVQKSGNKEDINSFNSKRMSSMGIGILNLGTPGEKENKYVHDYITMYHFFSRKWLLVRYSIGFVVFPGGFGTLDEFFEIITLIQCNRMPSMPIVLIGKEYWQPVVDWAIKSALKEKLITDKELRIFHVTDDIKDAYSYILDRCQVCDKEKTEPFYTE